MYFPVKVSEVTPIQQLRKDNQILTWLIVSLILEKPTKELTIPLVDESYNEYSIEMDSNSLDFRPGGFTILKLELNDLIKEELK